MPISLPLPLLTSALFLKKPVTGVKSNSTRRTYFTDIILVCAFSFCPNKNYFAQEGGLVERDDFSIQNFYWKLKSTTFTLVQY